VTRQQTAGFSSRCDSLTFVRSPVYDSQLSSVTRSFFFVSSFHTPSLGKAHCCLCTKTDVSGANPHPGVKIRNRRAHRFRSDAMRESLPLCASVPTGTVGGADADADAASGVSFSISAAFCADSGDSVANNTWRVVPSKCRIRP